MTLYVWIASFRYHKHVISPFEGLVSLVLLRSILLPILPLKSIFSRVGPCIKVVVLYEKMTLDFWITSFHYKKHVISSFAGLVLLVFLLSRLRRILPLKSIFLSVWPFIKIVFLYVKMTLDFWIASFHYGKQLISSFAGLVLLLFLLSR